MMSSKTAVTLEEVLDLVKQLKLVDKVRLIERVAPQIERELAQTPVHRKSLRGLWGELILVSQTLLKFAVKCGETSPGRIFNV
ncbi:MAG: hypothetical protein WBL95_27935 [Microcoleus sp.]